MSLYCALIGWSLLCSELVLMWRRRSSRDATNQAHDCGSLAMLWRVIGASIAAGFVVTLLGWGPRLPLDYPWGRIGLGVFALGTALRWWAIWHLGRFFTVDVALAQDHRVVETGPYRWVRHPSYSGLLLQFIGLAFSLNNLLAIAVILVPVFYALHRRMAVEEAALQDTLGNAYIKYTSHTKRLVPLVY